MQRAYHVAETALARTKIGALARIVGGTSSGDDYFATWYTTGSVAAERSGMSGAFGLCDALDHLRAHMQGKSWGIRRLAAFYPPQRGKSTHVTELFPAAIFGVLPTARGIATGYADDFMTRTPSAVKWVMNTPGYRATYPLVNIGDSEDVEGRQAKDNAHRIEVVQKRGGSWVRSGGSLTCRSLKGQVIGEPMDYGAMDDMYANWEQAQSIAESRIRRNFYNGVFKQRQQSRRTVMVLGFTPWTSTDLAAYIIDQWEKEGEPYLVLRYPSLQRHDTEKEIERFMRSEPQQIAMSRFLRVPPEEIISRVEVDEETGHERMNLGPYMQEHGLRPYDKRPVGMGLLPSHRPEVDQEFFEQKKRSADNKAQYAAQEDLNLEAATTGAFPADAWRWYDPAKKNVFRKVVISGDPNSRETIDGSFFALGVWGLDPVPELKVDGKKVEPALGWYCHRIDEARGRWGYSDGKEKIIQLLEKWVECRDLVIEHKANGQSLATDIDFVKMVRSKGVTFWLYETNGVLVKVRIVAGKIVHERQENDQLKAKGGAKTTRWSHLERPQAEGFLLLPLAAYARITCDWVTDRNTLDLDPEERQGYITEFTYASPDNCNDRPDETAQLVAFATTLSQQSDWSSYRQFAS
jgi:hypothetical protein